MVQISLILGRCLCPFCSMLHQTLEHLPNVYHPMLDVGLLKVKGGHWSEWQPTPGTARPNVWHRSHLLKLNFRQSRLSYTATSIFWPPPGIIIIIVGIIVIIIIWFKGELIIIILGTAINPLMCASHHHHHHHHHQHHHHHHHHHNHHRHHHHHPHCDHFNHHHHHHHHYQTNDGNIYRNNNGQILIPSWDALC